MDAVVSTHQSEAQGDEGEMYNWIAILTMHFKW